MQVFLYHIKKLLVHNFRFSYEPILITFHMKYHILFHLSMTSEVIEGHIFILYQDFYERQHYKDINGA